MVCARDKYSYGLIAGGMNDGFVHLWDPAKLVSGVKNNPDALIVSIEQHQGGIRGLQFNPHRDSSHLLASGGNDGEVYVMSLERPEEPNVFVPAPPPNNAKHTAEVTKVGWNSQVAYILASAAQNGSCYVWDLRQKKAWCELRDPAGGSISDLAWNPDQGLNIITASGDDKNPVLKLWDLRSSTSLPLATLSGHSEGILSVSWCPTDPSLILSCGKDNQTILWDLFLLQPVYNLQSSHHPQPSKDQLSDQNVFTGKASSAGQRRYHVSWSPCLPAVIGACSFDRSVQFYSLSGVRSKLGRAPKWLRRPCGASFGFGGKLVCFDSGGSAAATGGNPSNTASHKIRTVQVVENAEIVASADHFHQSILTGDFKSFCEMKAASARSSHDRDVWNLMKVIWFENSAREELLKFLGFSADAIEQAVGAYVASKQAGIPSPPRSPIRRPLQLHAQNTPSSLLSLQESMNHAKMSADELFSTAESLGTIVSTTSEEQLPLMKNQPVKPSDAEPVIAKAIVAGNFAGAVDCCLSAGLLAEALLLAQCGDQSLWLSTQEAFFNLQKHKRPFLSILHAIIKQDLRGFILHADLSSWRETMAILSTYAKTEEFPLLCETLAYRLENENQDMLSATLCYMCATNVTRVLDFWVAELHAANKAFGGLDTHALQQFVEKVVVFTQANPTQDLGKESCGYFVEYASLLASQGRLDMATYFLKGSNQSESVLADRLYHAAVSKPIGSRPPPFPFNRITVSAVSAVAVKPTATTSSSAAATRSSMAANQPIVAATSGPGQLPAGWLELVDPASGRPYYVNQATSKSQWERPAVMETPKPVVATAPAARPMPMPLAMPTPAGQLAKGTSPTTSGPSPAAMTPMSIPSAIPGMSMAPHAHGVAGTGSTTVQLPQPHAFSMPTVAGVAPMPMSVKGNSIAMNAPTAGAGSAVPVVPGLGPMPPQAVAMGNAPIPTGLAMPTGFAPTMSMQGQAGAAAANPPMPPAAAVPAKPVAPAKPPIQSEAIQALGNVIEQVAGRSTLCISRLIDR
jgi:protein transport protein SEC31